MNNNTAKNINIKQILILIFFVIIILLGIITTNNYDKNATNTNSTTEISYTLENIPEYSTSPYVVINNNNPNFQEQDILMLVECCHLS